MANNSADVFDRRAVWVVRVTFSEIIEPSTGSASDRIRARVLTIVESLRNAGGKHHRSFFRFHDKQTPCVSGDHLPAWMVLWRPGPRNHLPLEVIVQHWRNRCRRDGAILPDSAHENID